MSRERDFKVGDIVYCDGSVLEVRSIYQPYPLYAGHKQPIRVLAATAGTQPMDGKGVTVDAPEYHFVKAVA